MFTICVTRWVCDCARRVSESTVADILWHSKQSMTQHYSVAQIVEIHSALEKIRDDTGRWNKSLAMLRREQQEGRGEARPRRRDPESVTQNRRGAIAQRRPIQ